MDDKLPAEAAREVLRTKRYLGSGVRQSKWRL